MKKILTVLAASLSLGACAYDNGTVASSPYTQPAVVFPTGTGAFYGYTGGPGSYASNSNYYGYNVVVPRSYSAAYGSHGWWGSPFNGGTGPGTPGVGTPG